MSDIEYTTKKNNIVYVYLFSSTLSLVVKDELNNNIPLISLTKLGNSHTENFLNNLGSANFLINTILSKSDLSYLASTGLTLTNAYILEYSFPIFYDIVQTNVF